MNTTRLFLPVFLCGTILAQEFDVATIKPSAPGTIAKVFMFTPGGGLKTMGSTLRDLIVTGYDVRPTQIQGGPSWAAVDRYDVAAKVINGDAEPAGLSNVEREKRDEGIRLRTRALLAHRFNLSVHKETRELALYELHIDKNGPRRDALKESDATLGIDFRGDAMFSKGGDMHDLVLLLSSLLKQPVIDKTGLPGKYSFTLRWSSDQLSAGPVTSGSDVDKLPSIFTALREQLGLRLDSTKGPMEVLVIDHAERPTDN